MADEKSYGWTGKILRVNLTSGEITTQSTEPYKSYIGGMGLGNKIMYDEVPAGTDPFSAESKIVYAVGPLTASGVPLAGRTTCCHLSTYTTDHLVVDSHCGGMLGAKIKLAGWDAIVVEGISSKPVYLCIKDDDVQLKSADTLWGSGTRATFEKLARIEGTRACVAAIGPAGENLVPYACMINTRSHSAGAGLGAIMGSKKLKALVVEGNGSVNVADPKTVAELSDYMLSEVIGSNNNHVVPSTQQEWAEYYAEGSRWTARNGLYWGAAEGEPIETGEPKPYEINRVGYRCMKATMDLGPEAEKYTVKMDGCHGCPIHCYGDVRVPAARDVTGLDASGNTCVSNFPYRFFVRTTGFETSVKEKTEEYVIWNQVMSATVDDLGLWCNYAQLYRDIPHCIATGVFKRVLPPEEYAMFDWDKFKTGDPQIIVDILRHIAQNDNEMSYIAHGPIVWCKRWNDMEWFDKAASALINYRGWPVHHAIECFGQVGGVYNMLFNRDDMIHSAVNFEGSGLPIELQREIAAEVWGSEDACDAKNDYTPMNDAKANFCWWSVVTDVLHDSLTLCNWVWPMTVSPTKARNYRGDLDLEAKFFKAVTGVDVTTEDLYKAGSKIMTLQRANTVRGMASKSGQGWGNNDLRGDHDVMTEWAYTKDPDKPVFSEGTNKMDREDFQLALGMVYGKFGWDEKLGCPTRECLDEYDMPEVKAELDALGLLP